MMSCLAVVLMAISQCDPASGFCVNPQGYSMALGVPSLETLIRPVSFTVTQDEVETPPASWYEVETGGRKAWVRGWRDAARAQIVFDRTKQPYGWPPKVGSLADLGPTDPVKTPTKAAGLPVERSADPNTGNPTSGAVSPSQGNGNAVIGQVGKDDWRTQGVDLSKVSGKENFRKSDDRESGEFVREVEAVQKGVVQADEFETASKLSISVISGNRDERKRVAEEIRSDPSMKPLASHLFVSDFDPSAWQVEGFGDVIKAGKPSIVIQDSGGRVLHRQMDWTGGAPKFAEAVRKIKPDYDPKRDADLRQNGFEIPSVNTEYLPYGIIGLSMIALVILTVARNGKHDVGHRRNRGASCDPGS